MGRIYRHICFLRSEGRADEAQVLEHTELAEATALARPCAGSEFEAETILQRLIAEETERVADAIAFAEVLVPMLAERLAAVARPVPAHPPPVPRRVPPAPLAEPRGIADFIDDMLRQERRAHA